jgi:hypothetical protein
VDYYLTDPKPWPFDLKNRIRDLLVFRMFKLSPEISALLFGASSLLVLVKCRKTSTERL